MLNNLKYINRDGKVVDFANAEILVNDANLHSYKWGYNVQYNKVRKFFKNADSQKILIRFYGANAIKNANQFYDLVDSDVTALEEGKLYCGNYYAKGYFVSVDSPKKDGNFITIQAEYINPQGWWWYPKDVQQFGYGAGAGDSHEGLDFPHSYPYDYSPTMSNIEIANDAYTDCDFKMTIYAPASNPTIYINGQPYHIDYSWDEGYVTINTVDKTVYLTEQDGSQVNLFAYRDRTNYIFQKIPTGSNLVAWDSDMKFDIQLIEKRSIPKWI